MRIRRKPEEVSLIQFNLEHWKKDPNSYQIVEYFELSPMVPYYLMLKKEGGTNLKIVEALQINLFFLWLIIFLLFN
ncbi:hypothetical protein P7G70_07935 [Enterococcus dispar]|nr:hypothetical protein [Enterococcus dispar]